MARPIDADALIKWIDLGHLRSPCELCYSEYDIVNILKAAPTIDAAPVRRGEWVQKEIPTGYFTPAGNAPWVCSACEAIKSWDLTVPADNFCPSCGAEMRRVSE